MTSEKSKTYFQKEYKSGTKVVWGKSVAQQLRSAPRYIAAKFYEWVDFLHLVGLSEVRKRPGFHDEPLKGDRHGQRSVRLNRSYRAIYVERSSGAIELVEVIEVTKHDY